MVESGLGTHAPPQQAARGLDVVAWGVQKCFLAVEGPPGSFFPRARAHGMVDHAAGPCGLGRGHRLDAEEAGALCEPHVLVQGRRLDAEAAEALRELHRPRLEMGEVARGMERGSPWEH